MADEETIRTEEIQEDTKTEDIKEEIKEEEVKTEEVPDEEEEKKSFIQKTMDKLGIGGGTNVEDKVEDEEGELISDKFTDAAAALGWTDEDIIRFASKLELNDAGDWERPDGEEPYTDAELEEMIPYLAAEELEQKDESSAKESDKDSPDKPEHKDDSSAVKALRQELADLKKEIGAVQKDKATQEQLTELKAVDSAFDKASEKFEVFGKTEELPRFPAGPRKGQLIPTSPAYRARDEVYSLYTMFRSIGSPVDGAFEDALTWYKGKHLETDVKRNLVKDLKRKETKLSAKRMGKETVKTYDSEEDRKAEVVREAARKRGIEL